ncbi:MAG: diadenylate cyclase, partial [Clostridia bacterium]|nr:diadenylate cyclase [Clostridia bacterium]
DYGTRHRAGIGVTEVAYVSSIIVSEETGIVSVVKRGEITRYIDSESLKRFLREYYWKDFNTEGKKS